MTLTGLYMSYYVAFRDHLPDRLHLIRPEKLLIAAKVLKYWPVLLLLLLPYVSDTSRKLPMLKSEKTSDTFPSKDLTFGKTDQPPGPKTPQTPDCKHQALSRPMAQMRQQELKLIIVIF
jgi:hypothetical protein